MFWPTPQDYNEALQLSDSFADPDLRKGRPELNSIGLPRPITGAFASVYRIHGQGKDWAVKCFLRDVAGQQERYAQIGKFVHTDNLPYTIDFEYIERGLCVHDKWYPILKMEWVEGPTINEYVYDNLQKSAKLSTLADRFHTMTNRLHDEGIAHGDLQHGNMLIVNDDIVLVDYDGMYVPSLKGERSNELGHRNYQHPKRAAEDFGPYLDDFSEWSIYVSLKCLSIDPELWFALGADDDCMLFKQVDYMQPEKSRTFSTLEYHKSDQIRALAKNFRLCMHKSVTDVPKLRTVFDDISLLPPVEIPTLANPIKQARSVSIEETIQVREIPAGVALAEEGLTLVVSDSDQPMLPSELVIPSSVLVTHPLLPAKTSNGSYQGTPYDLPNKTGTTTAIGMPKGADHSDINAPYKVLIAAFFLLIAIAVMTPNGSQKHYTNQQDTIVAATNAADVQFDKKNYTAAADQYHQALNDAISAYGSSDVRTAHIMLGLARADFELKAYSDAYNSARTAAQIYSSAWGYGVYSSDYVECEMAAAEALMGSGDYVSAGNSLIVVYDEINSNASDVFQKYKQELVDDIQTCYQNASTKTETGQHFRATAQRFMALPGTSTTTSP